MTHDIETTSLPAHVSLCQERYQRLSDRFDHMESRMDDIEQGIRNLNEALVALQHRDHDQWMHARDVIIGVLITVTGYLAVMVYG